MEMNKLTKHIKDVGRFNKILSVFFEEGFDVFISKINLHHHIKKNSKKRKNPHPARLRKAFERLGPAFIKLGQILSVRPDMIPEEYCQELRKLQEHTQPVQYIKIKNIMELETGKKINKLFSSFNKTPLATASLAQVHKAKLKTGEDVVVKVQKPNTKDIILRDLDILFFLAHLLDKNFPKLRNYNLVEIIKEYASWTLNELDFKKEAENIKTIHENLKDQKVVIPKVYDKYTTDKVLILEFEKGENIYKHNFKTENKRKEFCQRLINSFSQMVFVDGFFHADPHPGNIFVINNNIPLLLDFGMVGTLSKDIKKKITKVFITMINKDIHKCVDGLIDLSEETCNADLKYFKKETEQIIRYWYGRSINECSFIKTIYKVINLGITQGLVFPPSIVLLAKSIVDLEGIGLEIYPKANIEEMMRPNIEKMVMEEYNPINIAERTFKTMIDNKDLYTELPEHLLNLLKKIETGKLDFHIDDNEIKDIEKHMDSSSSKKSLAYIISALFLATPIFFYVSEVVFLGINLGYVTFILAFILLMKLFRMIDK
jgi:ubiquinone biosynthesis protein